MSALSGKTDATKQRTHGGAYRLVLLVLPAVALVAGMSSDAASQQASPPSNANSENSASCSMSQTKTRDQISIKCQGMNQDQSERVSAAFEILPVMNKLLEDKIDPELVTAKLAELTKSATRTPQVKTYFCDGMWKSSAPNSAGGVLDTKTGGNDSEFLGMLSLLEKKQYDDLVKKCTANIKATPEWLTPRLFCGLAYVGMDRKAEARAMLAEFQKNAGTSYSVPDCHDMLDILRRDLEK